MLCFRETIIALAITVPVPPTKTLTITAIVRYSRLSTVKHDAEQMAEDGSYYYSNPDGSTYYNDGNGNATYTPPGSNK
jgi:hypothetical protein